MKVSRITRINAKSEFFSANERPEGEGEKGKGRGSERRKEMEIGSEALAGTEKIANAPARITVLRALPTSDTNLKLCHLDYL